MKTLKFLLAGAVALMAFAGCEKENKPQAYIILGEEELLVSSCGRTVSVAVESNYDWEYSYNSDWFEVKKSGKNLSITYDTNETGTDRKGVVAVTAGNGGKNIAETELKITQSRENFDALILEYTITENSAEIKLPIYSVTNATVDWGDGTSTTTSTSNPSHTYTTPGIYTVTINGTVKRLFSGTYSSMGELTDSQITGARFLTAVIQWGDTGLTNMTYAFYRCISLTSLPDNPGPFSNVSRFTRAFHTCYALEKLPERIFDYCSNATDFSEIFEGCYSLVSVPENLFSSCSLVTDFSRAFYGCTALTTVPENIFSSCASVTDFSLAFYGCTELTSAPSFKDCSSAKDFSRAFDGCTALTTVPENMFSGCASATTFEYVFYECKSLVSAPSFIDCSSVTTFSNAFSYCFSLITIPGNMFSGCSSVTDFSWAFFDCNALTTVPTEIFNDSFLVTDFHDTFYNCSSVSGESPYTEVDVDGEKVKVHLYERENYAKDMRWAIPTNYSQCFRYSTFSDIDSIPSGWK